jgi:hypothetical protein
MPEERMKRPITLSTRRELTAAVKQRYQAADRRGKKLILDEFTKVTGYHRKHAIRILTHAPNSEPKSRVVRRVYEDAAKEALIVLWEAADRICGKRLKACCHSCCRPWSGMDICSSTMDYGLSFLP